MRPEATIFLLSAVLIVLSSCDHRMTLGPEGPGDGSFIDRVAGLVNDHRESLGCPRLRWSDDLAAVANRHALDMAQSGYFDHVSPNGVTLSDRLLEKGFRYFSLAAENIARGFNGADPAQRVFDGWIQSDGHRAIIENCGFEIHGIGFHEYHWTHVFLRW